MARVQQWCVRARQAPSSLAATFMAMPVVTGWIASLVRMALRGTSAPTLYSAKGEPIGTCAATLHVHPSTQAVAASLVLFQSVVQLVEWRSHLPRGDRSSTT